MNQFSKKISLLAIFTYLFYFIFSIVYYKERTVFTDISYHLFGIIKNNDFTIQNFRFNAVITQIFPLIARKLSLPLNVLAIIYSLAFPFYYFTCYLICGFILKQYRFALIILLANILFVTDTFYWIQSELPQGLTLLVLTIALATKQKLNLLTVSLICIALFAVGFAHPLLIFPFLYFLLFFLAEKTIVIKPTRIYMLALFYLVVLLLKNLIFKTQYESQAMGGASNIINIFPHYFHLYSNKHFLYNCLYKYYWIPLLSIVIVIYYFINHKWKKLFLFCVFMSAYLLLINVSYPNKSTTDFYLENLYLPISLFIALPFVFDFLPAIKNKKIAMSFVIIIMITGIFRIYFAHDLYTARLNWERNFLRKHNTEKLIIAAKDTPIDTLMMTWATPYEFWLLSTIEKGKTASIIINDDPESFSSAARNNNNFITTWGAFSYNDLPSKYFIFKDMSSFYKILK